MSRRTGRVPLLSTHPHQFFSPENCPSLTTLFRRPQRQGGKALGSAPGGPTSTDRFRSHRNLASKVLTWLPFFDSFEITIVVVLDDSLDQSDGAKVGSKNKLIVDNVLFLGANFYFSQNITKKKKHRAQNIAKWTRAAL